MKTETESTRERILEIARDLIVQHGYAGTSISQIAARLGTSKAAIYYHFTSKEQILDAMLAESLSAFHALADSAASAPANERAGQILGGIIDFAAGPAQAALLLQSDPSAMRQYAKGDQARDCETTIVRALAGPRPSRAKRLRARIAFAAAIDGTSAALAEYGRLTPDIRAEILGAALRALGD